MSRRFRGTNDRDRQPSGDASAQGSWSPSPGKVTLTSMLPPSRRDPAPVAPLTTGEIRRAVDTLLLLADELDAARGGGHARDARGVKPGADHLVHRAAGSSGQALPSAIREKFEAALGADLGDVRVHTGQESAAAAAAVGAKAYTTGQDIHFSDGRYDPTGAEGQKLLAHEVAHTVQQAGKPATRQHKLEVSSAGDSFEVEADRAAAAMVAGQPAVITAASASVARSEEGGNVKGEVGGDFTVGIELGEFELGKYFKVKCGYAAGVSYSGVELAGGEEDAEWSVKAGVKGSDKGIGAGVGVEKELESFAVGELKEVKPKFSAVGLELTTAGVKMSGPGLSLSTPEGSPVDVELKVLEFVFLEWKPGESPTLAGLETQCTVSMPVGQVQVNGVDYNLKSKGTLTLTIEPNYATIGEWIAEQAAKMLTAEVAMAGAFVAGGAMTLWAAGYAILSKDDIANSVDAAIADCQAYCRDFEAAVKGAANGSGPGYALGKAWAASHELIANASGGSVAEAAKGVDIYGDAWAKIWPTVKQQAIDAYWGEHGFEKFVTGGEGMGSGGFKTFKRVLDAAGSRVRY